MSDYIRRDESIGFKFGNDRKGILDTISNRFIGSNSPAPFVFRTFHTGGILCNQQGQYVFDFKERFRDHPGRFAYAFGKLWSENARTSNFRIRCDGPVKVYVNKGMVLYSNVRGEGIGDGETAAPASSCDKVSPAVFPVQLERGWNSFFLQLERSEGGFGCLFGNAMPQWEPCNFHAPFAEREGRAGFVYTLPLTEDRFGGKPIPDPDLTEESTGISWLPDGTWPAGVESLPAVCRVFDGMCSGVAYAWTCLNVASSAPQKITVNIDAFSRLRIWLDGELTILESGTFCFDTVMGFGKHDILVECTCSGDPASWGFRMGALRDGKPFPFSMPCDIKGTRDAWLFLGPFVSVPDIATEDTKDLLRLFRDDGAGIYWRVDEKDTVVRPFVENALYGRWTYPLGVTLYGLLRYGEISGRDEIMDYVKGHVGLVTKVHEYAIRDRKSYGFPGVNHQIAWLDALDDCGSFGSLMLECHSRWPDENAVKIGGIIADYMMNSQIRREDGAFYRGNDTMWADDLYMCVPFLCRAWKLTGMQEYLDEACRQILLFEKYLFMQDWNTMSHIYSFAHGKPTNIPWGRGNGWAVFSITELLEVLPVDHKDYEDITGLYNRLVDGYLKLQGRNGLWHQVLNREDTYEEASCTAMFLCAFVRGILKGYLHSERTEEAVQSVFCAWNGLITRVIDYQGNIYGVCRGSGFSFSSDYYKELSWNYNDTHGIGIIILAGTELMRLEEHLQRQ